MRTFPAEGGGFPELPAPDVGQLRHVLVGFGAHGLARLFAEAFHRHARAPDHEGQVACAPLAAQRDADAHALHLNVFVEFNQ